MRTHMKQLSFSLTAQPINTPSGEPRMQMTMAVKCRSPPNELLVVSRWPRPAGTMSAISQAVQNIALPERGSVPSHRALANAWLRDGSSPPGALRGQDLCSLGPPSLLKHRNPFQYEFVQHHALVLVLPLLPKIPVAL